MRPALLLIPGAVDRVDALAPLSLVLAQGGWTARVVDPGDIAADHGPGQGGGAAVVVAHGAAGSTVATTTAVLRSQGWEVSAIALLDADLPERGVRGLPSVPVGYLRLTPTRWAEAAEAAGWPVRDAPGGHHAACDAPRQLAGPLLRLLGDLGVPGGLV